MKNRKTRPLCLGVFVLAICLAAVLGVFSGGCASSTQSVGALSTTPTAADPPTTTTTLAPTTTTAPSTTTTTTALVTSTTSLPSSTTSTVYTHPVPSPVRVVIPAIKADGPVVSVGLLKNGAMEVPSVKYVGWYKLGPVPGASGPAVLLGHVSYSGVHGTFYDLKRLNPGDQILVYDKEGDCATFEVDSRETILKSELPAERIWNKTDQAVIRLITCGGKYDARTKHYLSNVIVFAHLVR